MVIVLAGIAGTACHSGTQTDPATNLQVFRGLAASAAAELTGDVVTKSGRSDSSTLALTLVPREPGWFLEDTVARQLSSLGRVLDGGGSATYSIELGIPDLRVAYADIRTEGLFGPRIVDRHLTLSLEAKVIRQDSGSIVLAKRIDREYGDTIMLSDLSRVESSSLSFTRGLLPPEGWFSTFAEPLIVVGAIAVAVLLLFTVRS